jgi:SAM-dependent methyltransferase
MSIYAEQHQYFKKAYESGDHGWPTTEVTPFVVQSVKKLIRNGSLARGGRVLDLGCGEGRHTFACNEMGLSAIGLDYQPLAVKRARSMPKARQFHRNYSFLVGDTFHLPFRADAFDLMIDCGCFHHVRKSDTVVYLRNVVPKLKSGGHFILSCFSWKFRHHPQERRTRDWLVHHGHYDRFFKKPDFHRIFGKQFDVLKIEEEREGLYAFYQVLMQKKQLPNYKG